MPSNHVSDDSSKNRSLCELTSELSNLTISLDKKIKDSQDSLDYGLKRIFDEIVYLRHDLMNMQKMFSGIEDAFRAAEVAKTQHIFNLSLTCEKISMKLGLLDGTLTRVLGMSSPCYPTPYMHPPHPFFMPGSMSQQQPYSFPLNVRPPPPPPPAPTAPPANNVCFPQQYNDRLFNRFQTNCFPPRGPVSAGVPPYFQTTTPGFPSNFFPYQNSVPAPSLPSMQVTSAAMLHSQTFTTPFSTCIPPLGATLTAPLSTVASHENELEKSFEGGSFWSNATTPSASLNKTGLTHDISEDSRKSNDSALTCEQEDNYDSKESSDAEVVEEKASDVKEVRLFKLPNYDEKGWNCDTCASRNPESVTRCKACQATKTVKGAQKLEEKSKPSDSPETRVNVENVVSSASEVAQPKSNFSVFNINSGFSSTDKKSLFSFGTPVVSTSSSFNLMNDTNITGGTTASSKPLFSGDTESSKTIVTSPGTFGIFSTSEAKPALNLSLPPKTSGTSPILPSSSFGSTSKPVFGQKSFQGFTSTTASGSASSGSSSLFSNSPSNGKSIFGGVKNLFSSPNVTSQTSSLFGTESSKSIFGQAKALSPAASSNKSMDNATTEIRTETAKLFDKASSPAKSTTQTAATAAADNEDENFDPHYEPVLKMPENVEVCSGEENDVQLFAANARLYRFTDDQWKERGRGVIKVLKMPSGASRLLFRRDHVHKVVCNHTISAQLNLREMKNSPLSLCWVAVDYSENPSGQKENFCVRFKEENEAKEFLKVVEEAKIKKEKS